MAKTNEEKDQLYTEVFSHYQKWTEDNDIRRTRADGWNDVTDAYWGQLPDNWPYESRVVDPRIRTSIIDKDARLINSRLRGRLVPREGGDVVGARINNALLDFQWDSANYGGSMEQKLLISSQDARLYASKFALVPWKVIKEGDKVTFEGNEFEPLDIRDCGMDFACHDIKDAKWFQYGEWVYLEDLYEHNKNCKDGSKFKNLEKIAGNLKEKKYYGGGDKRSNKYLSRIKQLKGLQDRIGEDSAFPVIYLVHELRKDRVITFAPTHGEIIRDIPNPYKHGKIPVVQLKYYPLQDDPMGESEVEPVLSIWRGIQAVLCGYLDEMNIKMRPPLKIVEGQARIETLVYGPEAQWIVSRQDAVEEMRSDSSTTLNYFQTTYSSLISAFNTAMGDLSQGVSQLDPFNPDKTATEVKATVKQQNVRDERNQMTLAQFIKDMMAMWLSNNQQFLFSDPSKHEYVLRILGPEQFEYFKRIGMDEMEITDEGMDLVNEIITLQEGNLSDSDIVELVESAKVPKYPVKDGKGYKPKMKVSDTGDEAEVYVMPEDLQGTYDYVPDVKSMQSGADAEMQNARMRAIEMLSTNQGIVQQLMGEGWRPKIKDLLVSAFEDLGNKDSERFFEKIEQAPESPAGPNVNLANPLAPPTGQPLPNSAPMPGNPLM